MTSQLSAQNTTSIAPSVLQAIGRTPVIHLRAVVPPGAADVLVKLEFYNPTGSYKDRMALAMIEAPSAGAQARNACRRFTGGTGSSLAMVCAARLPGVLVLGCLRRELGRCGRSARARWSRARRHTPALFALSEIAVLAAEPAILD
jgi:hypothetical protein